MDRLSVLAKRAINTLVLTVENRIDEKSSSNNVIQYDPEVSSSLIEVKFVTKKALFWVRPNGSIAAIDGTRIILAGGRIRAKGNTSLDCFLKEYINK